MDPRTHKVRVILCSADSSSFDSSVSSVVWAAIVIAASIPPPTSASLAGAPNAGWSEVVVVVSAIVRVRVYRMLSAMLLSLTVFCRCGRESTHPASPGPALTAENAQDEPRAGLPLTLWLSDVKRQ